MSRFDVAISTAWAAVDGELDAPWMVEAWDEFSIENNFEGWEEALAKAKAEHSNVRLFTVHVDYNVILASFQPSPLAARMTEAPNDNR